MKVLITGATGLVGTELTKKCLKEGLVVHYLTTQKNKIQTNPNYLGFYWNPTSEEIDERAFDGVSAVINLVGAPISKYWTSRHKRTILNSRVHTSNLLFRTLNSKEHEVAHFISASGISIYPNSRTKLATEEALEQDTSFLAEVILAWEDAANQFNRIGIDVSIVRTGLVLSEKGGVLPKMVQPIKLGLGAALSSGDQWQSWIHIKDVANIYYHILSNQLEGVYNAVAPNPVTNKKFTKQIATRLNKPLWLPNVPNRVLRLLLGEMSELIIESKLVSSEKLRKSNYSFQFTNIESALDDLL